MMDFLGGGKEKEEAARDSVNWPFFNDQVVVSLDTESLLLVLLTENAEEGKTYR